MFDRFFKPKSDSTDTTIVERPAPTVPDPAGDTATVRRIVATLSRTVLLCGASRGSLLTSSCGMRARGVRVGAPDISSAPRGRRAPMS